MLLPTIRLVASEAHEASALARARESGVIDLYILVHRSLDLNDLNPWAASFMNRRALQIEADVPYVDIDFSGL